MEGEKKIDTKGVGIVLQDEEDSRETSGKKKH